MEPKTWTRNTAPATAARQANRLQRKAWEAQELLESLGYTVTAPDQAHEKLAAVTIKR